MKLNGLHHMGLFSADAERSREFYVGGLGGKEIHSWAMSGKPDRIIYLVDIGGGAVVEIIPAGGPEAEQNARWAHFCIDCDDVDAAYQLALKAGAVTKSEPAELMLGSKAVFNAFVYGPDGEQIEFLKELD